MLTLSSSSRSHSIIAIPGPRRPAAAMFPQYSRAAARRIVFLPLANSANSYQRVPWGPTGVGWVRSGPFAVAVDGRPAFEGEATTRRPSTGMGLTARPCMTSMAAGAPAPSTQGPEILPPALFPRQRYEGRRRNRKRIHHREASDCRAGAVDVWRLARDRRRLVGVRSGTNVVHGPNQVRVRPASLGRCVSIRGRGWTDGRDL